jgi:hypothetical protein
VHAAVWIRLKVPPQRTGDVRRSAARRCLVWIRLKVPPQRTGDVPPLRRPPPLPCLLLLGPGCCRPLRCMSAVLRACWPPDRRPRCASARPRWVVLMRGCGCVRAWVRVCLDTASRAAQAVGCPAVCLSVCAHVHSLRADGGADAWLWLLACVGVRVPRAGPASREWVRVCRVCAGCCDTAAAAGGAAAADGAAAVRPYGSVAQPRRPRCASARPRWVVLMRGCGCVRAWVRVCLGTASRAAQAVGCPTVCLSVCARVQSLRADGGVDAWLWLLACVGVRVPRAVPASRE